MTEGEIDGIRRRTGGRSARIRKQIYRAALDELLDGGLSGLTIPAIANRAGVHATTLYRRWPDAEAVALDAVLARSETQVAIPDSGSLSGDLERFLTDLDAYVRSPLGRALLSLQLAARGDADRVRQAFWQTRFAMAAGMIDRAVARGEIPSGSSPRQIIEFAIAPIYLHAAVTGDGFDGDRIKAHVRRTLAMAREEAGKEG